MEVSVKLIEDLGMLYPTSKSKKKAHYGLFECTHCLKHFKSNMYAVKKNNQKYCYDCSKLFYVTKHGQSCNRVFNLYNSMLSRCYSDEPSYYRYKEAGITVCDEWKDSFEAFETWSLENGYEDGLSLDRKDNSLGYSPSNCRWVTKEVQARNKRKLNSLNTSGYRGVSFKTKKNKYQVKITVQSKEIYLGNFIYPLEGAKAYDKYVLDNNLEHTINGVLEGFPVNPLNL